jgi:hypothetical protein
MGDFICGPTWGFRCSRSLTRLRGETQVAARHTKVLVHESSVLRLQAPIPVCERRVLFLPRNAAGLKLHCAATLRKGGCSGASVSTTGKMQYHIVYGRGALGTGQEQEDASQTVSSSSWKIRLHLRHGTFVSVRRARNFATVVHEG